MRPEEIRKLLGGYAAGNLTPEEEQALFAAALEDQELFDSLAREQSLRDVLRDPGARAELLAALDRPATGLAAFRLWLLRPMVARLATCGVAMIALVGVWRTFRTPAPTGFITVAELKQEELRPPATAPLTVPPAGLRPQAAQQGRVTNGPAVALADKAAHSANASDLKAVVPAPMPAAAPPPPPAPAASVGALASVEQRSEKEKDAAAPAEFMARKKEATSATTQAVVVTGAMEALPLDARAIFYLNQPAPAANAFAQPLTSPASGGGGAAQPARQARGAAAGLGGAAPAQLGVRASILRGDQEVDITTVMNAGESVRLKLIPNADGYLRVTEAGRTVATAAVQRFKPFETPVLPLEGVSPKQLVITFSRTPQAEAVSLDAGSRGNLVEPRADQGRATYVISGTPQVVVPVTLTFK